MDKTLSEQLSSLSGSKTLIVGIGNTIKADDGAGPLVCQNLTDKTSAELLDTATVPENYIQPIIKKAPQTLLIIDAIDFSASPGSIKIFKPQQLNSIVISTHTLSPHLFVKMIRRNLDVDVYFIGLQPAQTQLGQPVSPPVAEAIQKLTDVLAELFPPIKPE